MKKLSIKLNKTLTQVTTVNENIEKSTRKLSEVSRQFNIEVQFVKSVNYTFEQSL